MAAKKSSTHRTKARAKEVVSGGTAVRNRVKELSVGALRDGKLSLDHVSNLVHDVLEGAVEGIDKSIPESSSNVLRQVFDGLSEGVNAVASAGSAAASEVRERGEKIAGRSASTAAKRIRAANDEFLDAVKSFSTRTSKQVREELDALVARAERTGPKVAQSARKVAKAADGRLLELNDESARAGFRVARRAAGALAMTASGFLEGLSEAMAPKGRPQTAAKKKKSAGGGTARKKTKKKAKKKSSGKKASSKRRKA